MIKKFNDFVSEGLSGTEMIGSYGAAYGDTKLKNKTLSHLDTDILLCQLDDKFYTRDEYNDVYQEYLKQSGKPLIGFNMENLDIIVDFLQTN